MSRRRMMLIALVASVAVVTSIVMGSMYITSRDNVSEVEILNPAGDKGQALVVYHPGISDFQYKVTTAFADGLVSNGWRVEITTASSLAPTDLSGYDLLVLGTPTYGNKPAPSIERYLTRVSNLQGKRTVVLVTAGGTSGSTERVKEIVQIANGSLVKSITLFTMAPNNGDPMEIAAKAGREIPLP